MSFILILAVEWDMTNTLDAEHRHNKTGRVNVVGVFKNRLLYICLELFALLGVCHGLNVFNTKTLLQVKCFVSCSLGAEATCRLLFCFSTSVRYWVRELFFISIKVNIILGNNCLGKLSMWNLFHAVIQILAKCCKCNINVLYI